MEWKELLISLLYAVITIALPIVTTYVTKYLKARFAEVDTATSQLVVHDTINEVLALILAAVTTTSQTYVDSLKKSGTFDEEAQKKAFNDTKQVILSMMTEEAKEIVATVYQDIDKWIDLQIETAVRNIKEPTILQIEE